MVEKACKNCRYYHPGPAPDGMMGWCQRLPPAMALAHRLHDLIHDRIAMEGCVCETCSTRGCHHPATWEVECRGAGLRSRLIYTCDEHVPDEAILSPQDEIRRLVEE